MLLTYSSGGPRHVSDHQAANQPVQVLRPHGPTAPRTHTLGEQGSKSPGSVRTRVTVVFRSRFLAHAVSVGLGDNYEIVASLSDAKSLLLSLEASTISPDALLLDSDLSPHSSVPLALRVKHAYPRIGICLLFRTELHQDERPLRANCITPLLPTAGPAEVCDALERCVTASLGATTMLLTPECRVLLTPLLWRTVAALAAALTRREIAEHDGVTLSAVERRISRIRRLLGLAESTPLAGGRFVTPWLNRMMLDRRRSGKRRAPIGAPTNPSCGGG